MWPESRNLASLASAMDWKLKVTAGCWEKKHVKADIMNYVKQRNRTALP